MNDILNRLLTTELFALALVFCRVASAMMLLPGFGERTIMERARLLLALAVTLVVAPAVVRTLPPMPANVFAMGTLMVGEILVGLFIGSTARLLMTAIDLAGTIMNYQIGLSSAQIFNPMLQEQSGLISVLLVLASVVIVFQTDMHHLLLRSVVDSYSLFIPGRLPPIGDLTQTVVQMTSRSFVLALQLASPFILFGIILNVALGLVSRAMPQIQVFFVSLPLQLAIGFVIFAATLIPIMIVFGRALSDQLATFLVPS